MGLWRCIGIVRAIGGGVRLLVCILDYGQGDLRSTAQPLCSPLIG
jgi:hypothetical protein